MALFSFRLPLRQTARIADALERIAAVAEELIPPETLARIKGKKRAKPAEFEDLTVIDNETAAGFDEEEARERLSMMTEEEREALRKEMEQYR